MKRSLQHVLHLIKNTEGMEAAEQAMKAVRSCDGLINISASSGTSTGLPLDADMVGHKMRSWHAKWQLQLQRINCIMQPLVHARAAAAAAAIPHAAPAHRHHAP